MKQEIKQILSYKSIILKKKSKQKVIIFNHRHTGNERHIRVLATKLNDFLIILQEPITDTTQTHTRHTHTHRSEQIQTNMKVYIYLESEIIYTLEQRTNKKRKN